jgi:hypothetical protein
VRPGTHLHRPDEIGVDVGLLVQVGQKTLQVISDEVRLGACGGVQRRDRKSSDSLRHGRRIVSELKIGSTMQEEATHQVVVNHWRQEVNEEGRQQFVVRLRHVRKGISNSGDDSSAGGWAGVPDFGLYRDLNSVKRSERRDRRRLT